jgi:hypothetical protein
MLKTVKDACELHESTLEYQVAGGVENLAQVIGAADQGRGFFEKSYMTAGMEDLLAQGLLRLSGQSDQALFELAQAMGGGKTHLMAALGLLARHPSRRSQVLPRDVLDRLDENPARVAVFDGRSSPDHYLWGDIAEQIGKAEMIRPFWQNGPKAPGKDDWKNMIGDDPTLLLFDELPPYFLEARTISVGKGSMADVLTRALSNLFIAACNYNGHCRQRQRPRRDHRCGDKQRCRLPGCGHDSIRIAFPGSQRAYGIAQRGGHRIPGSPQPEAGGVCQCL